MAIIDRFEIGSTEYEFQDQKSHNLAAQYSTLATYAVGDYCIYNGDLYKCSTAITTAEAWTAAHWTAAQIAPDLTSQSEKIDELKTAFNEYVNDGKVSIEFTTIANEYVNQNTGEFLAYNGWSRTDYIPVTPNDSLGVSTTSPSLYNAFYDENKTYVSGVTVQTSGNITVPSTAHYIVLSNTTSALQSEKIWRNIAEFPKTPLSTAIINPYYHVRNVGDIVNGESLTKEGAYIKFDSVVIKTIDGNNTTKTWTNCKTDLANVGTNAVFRESDDWTQDCLRLLSNFSLVIDLDKDKFDVIYNTSAFPKHCIVLFGNNSSSYPYGLIYEQAKSNKNGLPNYVESIKEKINDVIEYSNNFTFSFVTDVHYYFDKTTGYYNSTNETLKYLDDSVSIDALINGGDSVLYGSKDRTYAIGAFNQIFEELDENKVVYCFGNHDANGISQAGTSQNSSWMLGNAGIETLMFSHNKNINRSGINRYFYRDFSDKKTRIIVLDTSDIDITFDNSGDVEIDPLLVYGVRQAQVTWLCNTALLLPSADWNALIIMHIGAYTSEDGFPSNNVLLNRDVIKTILTSYANKTTYSYEYTDSTYDGYFTLSGSGTFENANGNLVAVLSGHAHADGYTNKDGFNAIQTICSYPDVQQHTDRVVRTISEIAIDLGCIDATNRKIILTRFGYGSDREYSY